MPEHIPYVFTLLSAGMLLGLRHAMDADHIAAMSTIVARSGSVGKSLRWGALWGTGHTFTLLIAGVFVLAFKVSIPPAWATFLEVVVGLMLIWLGLVLLRHIRSPAGHAARTGHPQASLKRIGLRSFLVGAVHGLAGSAALLFLVLSTVDSISLGVTYIIFFGAGSIVGMLVFSGALALPLSWSLKNDRLYFGIRLAAAAASILIGAYIVYENLVG